MEATPVTAEAIQQRLAKVPDSDAARANWQAWYGFTALADIRWLLDELQRARTQKDDALAGLAIERAWSDEQGQRAEHAEAPAPDQRTRERDEARQDAQFLGDQTHPWQAFLDARYRAIQWLTAEGHSNEEIAGTLSMDAEQVASIKTCATVAEADSAAVAGGVATPAVVISFVPISETLHLTTRIRCRACGYEAVSVWPKKTSIWQLECGGCHRTGSLSVSR